MKANVDKLMALFGGMKTVDVQFKGCNGGGVGKSYTYKTNLDLAVGDDVVVDAPSTGMTVVVVTAVHKTPRIDPQAAYEYKWIVTKVDKTAYEQLLAKDEELCADFEALQAKLAKTQMIKQWKMDLGFGPEDKVPELDSLIERLGA